MALYEDAAASAERLSAQLRAAVQAALAGFSDYLSLLVRNNTHGEIAALLSRPDVQPKLAQALASARETSQRLVRQAWARSGADPASQLLSALQQDVDTAYAQAPGLIHAAVRGAFESVPGREFIHGVSVPGTNPSHEAAVERAGAVSAAIRDQAARLALRNRLSLQVASAGSATAAVLEEGQQRQAAGEQLLKRWRSRPAPLPCRWCLALDGVTVPLDAQFPHGDPVQLRPGVITRPPAVYLGLLPGPPRHPHCRCRTELVAAEAGRGLVVPEGAQELPSGLPGSGGRFLRASDIRALPEDRYRALLSFLQAAVHELGQLIRKLLGLG